VARDPKPRTRRPGDLGPGVVVPDRVHELRALVDRHAGEIDRPGPTADAAQRLQHEDPAAPRDQLVRAAEARGTGSDDRDVDDGHVASALVQ
jgi:hypothetical protein